MFPVKAQAMKNAMPIVFHSDFESKSAKCEEAIDTECAVCHTLRGFEYGESSVINPLIPTPLLLFISAMCLYKAEGKAKPIMRPIGGDGDDGGASL